MIVVENRRNRLTTEPYNEIYKRNKPQMKPKEKT